MLVQGRNIPFPSSLNWDSCIIYINFNSVPFCLTVLRYCTSIFIHYISFSVVHIALFVFLYELLFSSPLFHQILLSGALSLSPHIPLVLSSIALLYYHHISPTSLIFVCKRKSRRTCLFINVSKGSCWRKKAVKDREGGRVKKRKCDKEETG